METKGYMWGTYGKDGKQPLQYIPLVDLETEHLHNILITEAWHLPVGYVEEIGCILKERNQKPLEETNANVAPAPTFNKVFFIGYSDLTKREADNIIDVLQKFRADQYKRDVRDLAAKQKLPQFDFLRYYMYEDEEEKEVPKLFGGVKKVKQISMELFFEFNTAMNEEDYNKWRLMVSSYFHGFVRRNK